MTISRPSLPLVSLLSALACGDGSSRVEGLDPAVVAEGVAGGWLVRVGEWRVDVSSAGLAAVGA